MHTLLLANEAVTRTALLAGELEARGVVSTIGKVAAGIIVVLLVIGLVIGLIIGFFIGRAVGRRSH